MTGNAATILIIDDNDDRKLLELLLQSEGYLTQVAGSGEEALASVARCPPDLILLDIMMPVMDGYEVAETLKGNRATASIPIILVTVSTDHNAHLAGLAAGAEDFLTKPVDRIELRLRVRNLLRLKSFSAQLEAANKELEMFSYSVSHDLRAPLRHISGFVEVLKKEAGVSLSHEGLRHLGTIDRAAKQMGGMIDDLLAFARVGRAELRKTEVNLDALVLDTVADFNIDTESRNIRWIHHPLPSVRVDRALLCMVLVNLIANAVKFTAARAEAEIEIGCSSSGNGETVIFIHDNGAGFDQQYAGKLFGVFQRLHSQTQFEGTGIGLANVQRIVHKHGGRVWAEGAVDAGATFYFSLPD